MKKQVLALFVVLALTLTGCVGSGMSLGKQKTYSSGLQSLLSKQETFTFNRLPKTVKEFEALPEAALTSPHMTAALTAVALCAYVENPTAGIAMLNVLCGPQPLSARVAQLTRDSLRGKTYKPYSYFNGATIKNGYKPNTPYQIMVFEQGTSYSEQGYAKLFLQSDGADSSRPVSLRLKPSTGQWFLVEFSSLLLDMRVPDSQNRWR